MIRVKNRKKTKKVTKTYQNSCHDPCTDAKQPRSLHPQAKTYFPGYFLGKSQFLPREPSSHHPQMRVPEETPHQPIPNHDYTSRFWHT